MIRVSSSLYRGAILTAMLALVFAAGCTKKPPAPPAATSTSTASGREPDGVAASQPDLHQ